MSIGNRFCKIHLAVLLARRKGGTEVFRRITSVCHAMADNMASPQSLFFVPAIVCQSVKRLAKETLTLLNTERDLFAKEVQ